MNPVHLIRHRAALTQSELARVAGTSQPTIASYEAEQKSPTFRTLQRLAGASGVIIDVRVYSSLTREARRSLALHAAIGERLREAPKATVARARQPGSHDPTRFLAISGPFRGEAEAGRC